MIGRLLLSFSQLVEKFTKISTISTDTIVRTLKRLF
jgi:hypothetical protein